VYLALKPIRGTKDAIREVAHSVFHKEGPAEVRLKEKAVQFLVEVFGFPAADLERPVGELPFAERRTVELAKAFVTDRPVVLLDEPTAGLDESEQQRLIKIIHQLAMDRIVIVIEHNYHLLKDVADVVVFMKDGRIATDEDGEIAGTYDHVMSREPVKNAYIGDKQTSHVTSKRATQSSALTVLDAEIQGAGYNVGAPVLHDIQLSLPKGRITALVGPNGAGKSTLLRCLINSTELCWLRAKITKHECGKHIALATIQPKHSFPTYKIAQSGVILLRQENKHFNTMTVRENLEFAIPLSGVSQDDNGAETVHWFLESFFPQAFSSDLGQNSSDVLSRKAITLSGGQQQILAIGRAILACGLYPGGQSEQDKSFVFLLDEPTAGLQPSLAKAVLGTVNDLAAEFSLSFLIAEQSDIVETIADEVLKMENGRIVEHNGQAVSASSV